MGGIGPLLTETAEDQSPGSFTSFEAMPSREARCQQPLVLDGEGVPVVDGPADGAGLDERTSEVDVLAGRRSVADTSDSVHHGGGVTEVRSQPAGTFLVIRVSVAVAAVRAAKGPVAHRKPDVIDRGEAPPGELGPELLVDHFGEHGWHHDGPDHRLVTDELPEPVRELHQTTAPHARIGHGVLVLDVERDAVEAVSDNLEVVDQLEPLGVGVDVVEGR